MPRHCGTPINLCRSYIRTAGPRRVPTRSYYLPMMVLDIGWSNLSKRRGCCDAEEMKQLPTLKPLLVARWKLRRLAWLGTLSMLIAENALERTNQNIPKWECAPFPRSMLTTQLASGLSKGLTCFRPLPCNTRTISLRRHGNSSKPRMY